MLSIMLSILTWIAGILLAIPLYLLLKKAQAMLIKANRDKITDDVINFAKKHGLVSKNKEIDRKKIKRIIVFLIARLKSAIGIIMSVVTGLQVMITTGGLMTILLLVLVLGMSGAIGAYVVTMNGEQTTSLGGLMNNSLSDNSTTSAFTEEVDNKWASFLVGSYNPAFTTGEQAKEILQVFANDSTLSVSNAAKSSINAPDITVDLTVSEFKDAPGLTNFPNGYKNFGGKGDSFAYGDLMSIAESFVQPMIKDMQSELGTTYGIRNSGAGMGYRSFYHAGDGAKLKNGYWSRTLGAFSEHCFGVAQDFTYSLGIDCSGGTGKERKSANPEFEWLSNNAHKYGFIWRFKISGKDSTATGKKTGTIYEDWHWRFVGVYHATKFWEKCSSDKVNGYDTNDNYTWEDYWYENIKGKEDYPQTPYEAITSFYSSDSTKCTYQQYQSKVSSNDSANVATTAVTTATN